MGGRVRIVVQVFTLVRDTFVRGAMSHTTLRKSIPFA